MINPEIAGTVSAPATRSVPAPVSAMAAFPAQSPATFALKSVQHFRQAGDQCHLAALTLA